MSDLAYVQAPLPFLSLSRLTTQYPGIDISESFTVLPIQLSVVLIINALVLLAIRLISNISGRRFRVLRCIAWTPLILEQSKSSVVFGGSGCRPHSADGGPPPLHTLFIVWCVSVYIYMYMLAFAQILFYKANCEFLYRYNEPNDRNPQLICP